MVTRPRWGRWILTIVSWLIAGAAGATICGELMIHTSTSVQELQDFQQRYLADDIQDMRLRCREHQEFMFLLGRKGSLSRDSLPFIHRCRYEFDRFVSEAQFEQLAPELVAETYHRLAQLEILVGNRLLATQRLRRAIEIAEQCRDRRRLGLAHNTLGVVQFELGNYDTASLNFLAAIASLRLVSLEEINLARCLRNSTTALFALGRQEFTLIQEAIQLLGEAQRSEDICPAREMLVDTHVTLAQHLLAIRRPKLAVSSLKSARAELEVLIAAARTAGIESEIVSQRKYANVHVRLSQVIRDIGHAATADQESLPTVFSWQWIHEQPTEMIDVDLQTAHVMCGEFERQNALAVPWTDYLWANDVSRQIVEAVWDKTQIVIVLENEEGYYEALEQLQNAGIPPGAIQFSFCKLDSPWLRDMGPIAAKKADQQSIWFDAHVVRDGMRQRVETDALPRFLFRSMETLHGKSSLSVEGGAILANGKGLTLCTTKVFENNAVWGLKPKQIEKELQKITGAEEIVKLRPLVGERTGHIDLFATFVDPQNPGPRRNIASKSENASVLNQHAADLRKIDVDGQPLRVVRVPMPPDPYGQFANYTNVVFANGALLVPSWAFASAQLEAEVHHIYQELLPEWTIVPIDCSALASKGGALHCLTSNLGTAQLRQPQIRVRER